MIQDFPKISIVTPSYNQAAFLDSALQSILSQNYPNLELIVIDGGSTDGSVEIIKKYEKHLHFWCSEKDQGQYYAINKGFENSSGEIMSWLNSDDMYYPWTLKTVSSIMSQFNQVEWLTSLNAGWWDWHGFNTGFSPLPGFSKDAFLEGRYVPWSKRQLGWIQQESTFWKRSLWEKVGQTININYKLAGDFELWTRFYKHTELFATPSALGGFRSQDQQRSLQKQAYIREAEQALEDMRVSENWVNNHSKDLIYKFRLHQLPKIKHYALSSLGYLGKKIIRENGSSPYGKWEIIPYRFL